MVKCLHEDELLWRKVLDPSVKLPATAQASCAALMHSLAVLALSAAQLLGTGCSADVVLFLANTLNRDALEAKLDAFELAGSSGGRTELSEEPLPPLPSSRSTLSTVTWSWCHEA